MGELALSAILCSVLLGGTHQQKLPYSAAYDVSYVKADCVTDTEVIEVGLDRKRSSMDSIHQALFAAHLSGKAPKVIMIDTDGREGKYEYQVRITAQMAGVAYEAVDKDFLVRWQFSSYLRNYNAAGS